MRLKTITPELDNILLVRQRAFGLLNANIDKRYVGTASLHNCIGLYLKDDLGAQALMHLDSNYEDLTVKMMTYLLDNNLTSKVFDKILLLKSYLSFGEKIIVSALKSLNYSNIKVFNSRQSVLDVLFDRCGSMFSAKPNVLPLSVNRTEDLLFENTQELI